MPSGRSLHSSWFRRYVSASMSSALVSFGLRNSRPFVIRVFTRGKLTGRKHFLLKSAYLPSCCPASTLLQIEQNTSADWWPVLGVSHSSRPAFPRDSERAVPARRVLRACHMSALRGLASLTVSGRKHRRTQLCVAAAYTRDEEHRTGLKVIACPAAKRGSERKLLLSFPCL